MPTTAIALGFAAVGLLVFAVWAVAQLSRAVRTAHDVPRSSDRARRAQLRHPEPVLEQRLNEVANADRPCGSAPGTRSSSDELGVAFWNGGRRPRLAAQFPWREVRNIRADSMVVGGAVVPVVELRVRHAGSSVELPIILSPGTRPAIRHGPMRRSSRWSAAGKAKAPRRARSRGPSSCRRLTAPIPIITPRMAAAARR
jgi:hypothetical protein